MTAEDTNQTRSRRPPGRPVGSKASDAQKAAGKANIKKAHEAKRKRAEARRAGKELEKPRWKQLEDGDISVRDLTDKELIVKACANNDGSWEGRRHQLPARLIGRMEAEWIRRQRTNMGRLAKPAFRALKTRVEDDDAPAQQFAAAKMVIEYAIGKVPEVVHIGTESEYDRLQQDAFIVRRGGALAEELEALSEEQDGHEDIVDAEIVEE